MKFLNGLCVAALVAAAGTTASAVNFQIVVEHADGVNLTVNGEKQNLVDGTNSLDLEEYSYINATGVDPYMIQSVTNKEGTPMSVYSGSWNQSVYSTDEGQIYTISLKNLNDARTASCTVTVDDASKVRARLGGYYTDVTFANGANTLKFDPEVENTLEISSAQYDSPLYRVTLDGAAVTANYGSYTVNLTNGCTIGIEANYPDKDVTVSFTYSEKGQGAIAGVKVNNESAEFDGTSLVVKAGAKVELEPNYDYKITSMTVNGTETNWTGSYAHSFNVVDDTQVYIDAHPYGTYPITVNVTDPAQIKMYTGYTYDNPIILSGTSNIVQINETINRVQWQAAEGCYIVSASVNGVELHDNYCQIEEGTVITIETAAISFDETAVFWIDNKEACDTYFSCNTADRNSLTLETGYNVVPFYSAYVPFNVSWHSNTPVVGKVYVNDTLTDPMYEGSTTYNLDLKNLDVVKIFFAAEPVACKVNFDVATGVEAEVTRDVIVPVADLAAELDVFKGTKLLVAPKAGGDKIDVFVNTEKLTANEAGAYEFVIADAATEVKITKAGEGGISGIAADKSDDASPIYNLQGAKVNGNFDALPGGVYIINGHKVLK